MLLLSDLELRFATACGFVRKLPLETRTPDVRIEDDGDINFEWYAGKDCLISISVGPNCMNWASLIDGKSMHGHVVLSDIPAGVLALIRRVQERMPAESESE